MKFSILIANYNNGKYFQDCYNSIVSQTYNNWEAIIVDDCSTDNSIERITAIIKNDSRFHLVMNDKNYGCGYTKRKCADLATGDIWGYVDPDDTISTDALKFMIDAHKKNSDVSLVHSSFYYCNELMKPTSVFNKAKSVSVSNKFINQDAAVTAFSTFKRKFYDQTIGIDSSLKRAVDQDLYLKLSEKGPFYFIDKVLYNYRIHDRGISTGRADEALYWYLKVIMKTEQRRGINLEEEAAELLNRTSPENMQINLGNPRYLILAMIRAFKRNPAKTFKKLLLNKY